MTVFVAPHMFDLRYVREVDLAHSRSNKRASAPLTMSEDDGAGCTSLLNLFQRLDLIDHMIWVVIKPCGWLGIRILAHILRSRRIY